MRSLQLPRLVSVAFLLCCFYTLHAQSVQEIRGRVLDDSRKPLPGSSITIVQSEITITTRADGSFVIAIPDAGNEISLIISHVGKETVSLTIKAAQFGMEHTITLHNLNLRLPEVEVNGVRRRTAASNSSIVFDREAIEQTQALSVANVLGYLPGHTLLRPNVSIQGVAALNLRTAMTSLSEASLNNAFGISVLVDGARLSNDANMQVTNIGNSGSLISAGQNIVHPPSDREGAIRNGSLHAGPNGTYNAIQANNGTDLRQLTAENIESIEVISGVASARYGDYTTGMVLINRQAGVTPWRASVRSIEGSVNAGINKGFTLSPSLGALNINFDYLHSNNDPRDKLKGYQRIGGGVIWTYKRKTGINFRNTFSVDFNTTLDQTKQDPDDGNQRMAKFNNHSIRFNNRAEWVLNRPWLYNISLQASFNTGRQESYDQWYLNAAGVIGIANGMETGTYEGYFTKGYYLAVRHIIGKPVDASGRLEFSNFLKYWNLTHKIIAGVNYSYTANNGPGLVQDPDRPRWNDQGYKNDRNRNFRQIPAQNNTGFYLENVINTRLLNKPFNLNAGVRGDVQNSFFNVSPRISTTWKWSEQFSWHGAFGIATKAPGLAQTSPGNVYIDVPLINAWNENAGKSLYLVHTQVIDRNNTGIQPYRSSTFETGISWKAGILNGSVTYFIRKVNNGFATVTKVVPLILPNYTITPNPSGKPGYTPNGSSASYFPQYTALENGQDERSTGVELIVNTKKIRALQTSFHVNTSLYSTSNVNRIPEVAIPQVIPANPDRKALFGVYNNTGGKAMNIKSTVVSNTHISPLGMAVILTGEFFWVNRSQLNEGSIYPVGYVDRYLNFYPLTPAEAQQPEYTHLQKATPAGGKTFSPAMVYTNLHLRLSKEIGDYLRFSFNAYNFFNIRPVATDYSGSVSYYNGQPSYGAELIFTIK